MLDVPLMLDFEIGEQRVVVDGVNGQILSAHMSRSRGERRDTKEMVVRDDVTVIGVGGQSSRTRWPRSGERMRNFTDSGEYNSSSGPHDVAVDGVGGQSSITRWAMSGDGRRNRIDIGEPS